MEDKIHPISKIRYMKPKELGFKDPKKGGFIKCKCGEKALNELQNSQYSAFYCDKCFISE